MAKKKAKKKKSLASKLIYLLVLLIIGLCGYFKDDIISYTENNAPALATKIKEYLPFLKTENEDDNTTSTNDNGYSLSNIPEYNGELYVEINNGEPNFDLTQDYSESFELYSDFDSLGRCGVAYANVGKDIMPTETRGSISGVKPTGWHTVKYEGIDGNYLYNRCHLIAYELTGENANKQNLITCTRTMNVKAMLHFENMVAAYVKETGNHVLYRVTPIFEGDNLLASGAQMEGYSVEDNGVGIKFNVYVYNVEPGITIDYQTGDSKKE